MITTQYNPQVIKCDHKSTSANTKADIVTTILPYISFPTIEKEK